MRADTWEGEFNGPASPSTVRENIEVRFLFYSVAAGLGDGQGRQGRSTFGASERRSPDTPGPGCVRMPKSFSLRRSR